MTSVIWNRAESREYSSRQASLLKRRKHKESPWVSRRRLTLYHHPIQDRSDDEIRRLADAAFEEILSQIVAS